MKKQSNILILISSLLLAGVFLGPLWTIRLEAPQFPEGVEMYIWINKINGMEENTLNSINILNHYIGMQEIVPDMIPELKYFQYVALALIVLGLLAFFIKRKWLSMSWVALYSILVLLAFYDFYLWEYDYGHNLDPNAPIQVPGMVYQPPLIGSKYLLNFLAISKPNTGGYFLIVSILLANLTWLFEFKKNK
ncbi:MAG TPA: hypothetical protein PKH65_09060 [Bacteroidia bacterium]|nr:hypothetical protein [Bacteroidia bacterium]HNT80817.1 hypothetical protein [Bacteroidia bacterium]